MVELDRRIGAWTATFTATDRLAVLEQHGVPAGQIYTAREMLSDPHSLARGMVQRVIAAQGWDVPVTGVVPRFTATPGTIRSAGPVLGADTLDVLTTIAGIGTDGVAELERLGLVHCAGLIYAAARRTRSPPKPTTVRTTCADRSISPGRLFGRSDRR